MMFWISYNTCAVEKKRGNSGEKGRKLVVEGGEEMCDVLHVFPYT